MSGQSEKLTYRKAFVLPYKRRLTWVALGLSIAMVFLGDALFGLLYLAVYSLTAGKLELLRHRQKQLTRTEPGND